MMTDDDIPNRDRPLPGLVHRDTYMRELGLHPATGRRWQGAGKIVVRYLGRQPYVDVPATGARVRGEDRRGRRQAHAGKRTPGALKK
jgi:hypothetical protein